MTKLSQILSKWTTGDLHSLRWLEAQGVNQILAYTYFQRGHIEKIGPGVYKKAGDTLSWQAGVRFLQQELNKKLHVSSRTALELQGSAHYVSLSSTPTIMLCTYTRDTPPTWFKNLQFNGKFQYSMLSLFKHPLPLNDYEQGDFQFKISSRELAILEWIHMLDLSLSFETAENYLESLVTLQPSVVQQLLEDCSSIRTKRVFLYLAEKLSMPFFKKLNMKKIDLGSGRRVILTGGQYNKKYMITVPETPEENPF